MAVQVDDTEIRNADDNTMSSVDYKVRARQGAMIGLCLESLERELLQHGWESEARC